MLLFNHSGAIGDILFSLYLCKELSQSQGESKFNFHFQINNEQETKIGKKRVGFSIKDVEFLLPLLKSQSYINEITYSKDTPKGCFNLDLMRDLNLNLMGGDIRGYWYNLTTSHLPREFQKPIIKVEPNYKFKNKLLFTYTERYVNLNINYNLLEPFKNKMVFIGLEKEYQLFKQKYFDLQYIKVNNALEAAQYIAGAKGFMGNESGLFSLAECLKVPRILLSPQLINWNNNIIQGPYNVNPIGGWNEVAGVNEKMVCSVKKLLNIYNTAILVIAYNRFDILDKTIEALNKNKHYDLIVNFDKHNDIQNFNKIKDKILNYFPNAKIKMQNQHLGLDLNVITSIQQAFYTYNYDRIFYIEDDVYTDPTCLETLQNLMNWTDQNMKNIGIVQSWNNNLINDNYLKLHGLQKLDYSKTCTYQQNEIGYTGQNFWGCLISKKCWDIINPYIVKHFSATYNNNNFDLNNFQNLISKIMKSKASDEVKYRVTSRFNVRGWEPIVDLAMVANNLFKITLTNPRSKTMGEEGTTSKSTMFDSTNLNKIQTINSPNIPTQFILNQQSKKLWIKE